MNPFFASSASRFPRIEASLQTMCFTQAVVNRHAVPSSFLPKQK